MQIKQLVPLLMRARLTRLNNFDILTSTDWLYLANEIKKDFPDIDIIEAEKIVDKGVKGFYKDSNMPLNFTKVYQWFYKNKTKNLNYSVIV